MKKLLMIVIALLLVFFIGKEKLTFTKQTDLQINASAAILIDADSGKVLFEKNSDEALPIASMTKMMTQYLVLEAIQNGSLTWESRYEPSVYVQEMMAYAGAVTLGMKEGQAYSVTELFTAMTVNSSNDAAVALAEIVSGSEAAFVERMNAQAKKFKLKKTQFFNASGLDGNYIGKTVEETNLASAKDVAKLANRLMEDYPEVRDFTNLTNFTTSSGLTLWSTNLMLAGMPQALPGIDGLKTGYTDLAGPCFTSTGVFDGKRIISVVMNVEADGDDHITPKFTLTHQLIEEFVLN